MSARARRRGLLLGPASAVAFALGGCGLARAVIFPGCPDPLPRAGAALGANVEVVEYTAEDGVPLRGALVRADRAPGAAAAPAAVLFHGNAESALSLVGFARALAAEGCDVFVAEYRGYGGCPGAPSEEGLVRDGRAALAAAERALRVPPREQLLIGRSLGTGVASLLAGEGLGRAVALLSPYVSIERLARELAPGWLVSLLLADPFESLEALGTREELPVLVIHGVEDEVIPFDHGRELAAALGARARLVPLAGVAHNDLFARAGEQVVAEVTSFARSVR